MDNSHIIKTKSPIALTFDDGPSEHTSRILDTLEKYNAKASFFVLGERLEAGKDIVKRAHDMGNEVIVHSWTHANLTTLTPDEIKKELTSTQDAINKLLGTCPNFYRPPYGANDDTVKKASKEIGFSLINWSIDALDWENKNADIIFTKIMTWITAKAIILCHDVYESTAEAMERVIPTLQSGFELVTVSELMKRCEVTLEAGRLYDNGSDEIINGFI
ncbi:MAG: polysaccharide deacetylase family protein [Defluviitaleaceae bacterium]|nr:polysaccharide deacetylase family protein [Defluviitaleaceae bacterium]